MLDRKDRGEGEPGVGGKFSSRGGSCKIFLLYTERGAVELALGVGGSRYLFVV